MAEPRSKPKEIDAKIFEYLKLRKGDKEKADDFFARELYNPFLKLITSIHYKFFPDYCEDSEGCITDMLVLVMSTLDRIKLDSASSRPWSYLHRTVRNAYKNLLRQLNEPKRDIKRTVRMTETLRGWIDENVGEERVELGDKDYEHIELLHFLLHDSTTTKQMKQNISILLRELERGECKDISSVAYKNKRPRQYFQYTVNELRRMVKQSKAPACYPS